MSHGLIEPGNFQAIQKRGLSEETCRKWGYSIGTYNGQTVHIATYRNTAGEAIAQKVRFPNKEFTFLGDTKNCGLYGQHLWRDQGKRIVVTEGELDALSVSQVQDNKWPVVSIPNGAQGAKKSIQRALEWLEGFEEVVFLFDNDEHGIAAAKECALLLTPGKAKIGKLPLKDANDMLVAGRAKELIDATWSAKVFRPDGIINGKDLWDKLNDKSTTRSVPYPWSGLDRKLLGLRVGELVTFTAGSGIGKSQVCRELAHHLLKRGESVGYIALEESTTRTALGLVGIELNKPLHISKEGVSESDFKNGFDRTVGNDHCFLYDHFGSTDSDNLLSRLRYLARGCGCQWLILDHISIVVSGSSDGDERRLIDNLMTKLRTLVEETGVGMLLVSHLKRPEGGNKGHEEGAQVTLAQLRGSAAIAQLSDIVVGLERDQQDEDTKNITTVRVLKNRFSGETGVATTLAYDPFTGRLHEGTVTPSQMMAAGKDF
jgi:twinkle protein